MHHASRLPEPLAEWAKELGLGPTGDHPTGRLDEDDAGGLQYAVGIAGDGERIIVNFGTPLAYLGMTVEEARALSQELATKADLAEQLQGE